MALALHPLLVFFAFVPELLSVVEEADSVVGVVADEAEVDDVVVDAVGVSDSLHVFFCLSSQ